MDKKINFLFHPYKFDSGEHTIEKADDSNKKKRRYFRGVASGSMIDGHGERMTENCIKSFQEQAASGDILLFADKHGVAYTEDIGILSNSKVLPSGDWYVEFRLYDEDDDIGSNTLETIDKLWKQCNGLPPYKNKKQKGFSIEGVVGDDGIIEMDSDGRRVVDNVILDGCVIVPRPAYQTSIAHALYKTLDEIPPWQIEKSYKNILSNTLDQQEKEDSFYKKVYNLNEVLSNQVETIMVSNDIKDKKERLEILYDEYKTIMVKTILDNANIFEVIQPYDGSKQEIEDVYKGMPDRRKILVGLLSKLDIIQKELENNK